MLAPRFKFAGFLSASSSFLPLRAPLAALAFGTEAALALGAAAPFFGKGVAAVLVFTLLSCLSGLGFRVNGV